MNTFSPLFVTIAGFIIGLGALTVIDWHGFLAQKSAYWTEATIRSHKITKPLIWFGLLLATTGSCVLYWNEGWDTLHKTQAVLLPIMVLNGSFLSFWVSPRLLAHEREGRAAEILPLKWRQAIFASFILSFLSWWSQVVLFIIWMTHQ